MVSLNWNECISLWTQMSLFDTWHNKRYRKSTAGCTWSWLNKSLNFSLGVVLVIQSNWLKTCYGHIYIHAENTNRCFDNRWSETVLSSFHTFTFSLTLCLDDAANISSHISFKPAARVHSLLLHGLFSQCNATLMYLYKSLIKIALDVSSTLRSLQPCSLHSVPVQRSLQFYSLLLPNNIFPILHFLANVYFFIIN